MFGYVKPFQPELKMKEYEYYRAVYCGLCKQLGKQYGFWARMTLSYDITYLVLLSQSMQQTPAKVCSKRCMAHPFRKRACVALPKEDGFACGVAMLMCYYKIKDDLADRGFLKTCRAVLMWPFLAAAKKKAAQRYPEADRIMAQMLTRQQKVEADPHCSPDKAAEPTAAALGKLFAMLSEEEAVKRVLDRYGYLLGKYIYTMDALDDWESDEKAKNFNVLVLQQRQSRQTKAELAARVETLLNISIAEMAAAYELLPVCHDKELLNNIVYLGLSQALQQLLRKKKEKNEEWERTYEYKESV